MRSATSAATAASSRTPEPSPTGDAESLASARAVALSPLRRIASSDGPTKAMPASAQAAGSSGRSERKP